MKVPDLLSSRFTEAREERHAPSQNLVLSPEQLKDFESSVEVTLRRFANSLQPVLENVHRSAQLGCTALHPQALN